eukprot:gb/GECG01006489.1/.p1 GENE.gb/GECG01006489.1/~~gb/GECG01006489.1/.p1  ORF type:complete len:105 (+),score=4.55 gb/GECG01006489.1/:1-315(+)
MPLYGQSTSMGNNALSLAYKSARLGWFSRSVNWFYSALDREEEDIAPMYRPLVGEQRIVINADLDALYYDFPQIPNWLFFLDHRFDSTQRRSLIRAVLTGSFRP